MKKILRLILINIFVICSILTYSQEKCKVLKPEINGTYEGKCKNGLAHGKGTATGTDSYSGYFSKGLPNGEGTYTWSTGEKYTGEWVNGLRHGIGKYTMKTIRNDSIQDGLWQNDAYKGAKPDKPKVTLNSGVDRYNFKKSNSALNRVTIDILQNGARNKKVLNLSIIASSGQDIYSGFLQGFNNVEFPVTIIIAYTTSNKLNTLFYNVKFDFVIYEPGDWAVELHN